MRNTLSLCPVCLKKIPAEYRVDDEDVYMDKACPEHGSFSTIVRRGDIGGWEAMTGWQDEPKDACPFVCGLCPSHRQNTCCIEVEITKRCNLNCAYCFEDGISKEPSLGYLSGLFREFVNDGRTFLHLSGGEPTMREDLPEIVGAAKKAGMQYIQLNSNGLRLAENESLVKALVEAGLSFVFLQFDGTNDEIYLKTRGQALFETKKKAIVNCSKYNLGVALVPTLVPGINTDNIGEIIRFGVENSPAVRGIHFQPVSYFGRYPAPPTDDMRFTLPELIAEIGKQADIGPECFLPSSCDHPLCGFHGDFVVLPDGLMSITKAQPPKSAQVCCCCGGGGTDSSLPPMEAVEKNRSFVGRRWLRPVDAENSADISTFEGFLARLRTHGFTITSMYFQDAYNVDIERLRHCSLHIYKDGRIMPFCLRYILR